MEKKIMKITKSQYDELKNSYLSKNRSMHSLYMEINKENTIDKQLFFKLINKIRKEEGLSDFYTPKSKRTMFPDKNPYVSV